MNYETLTPELSALVRDAMLIEWEARDLQQADYAKRFSQLPIEQESN